MRWVVVVVAVLVVLVAAIVAGRMGVWLGFSTEAMSCTTKQLVSGVARAPIKVVSFDNRPDEPFVALSTEINRRYCKRHGYDYEFFGSPPYERELPVYWCKVRLVYEEVCKAESGYVLWMDSDAVFTRHEFVLTDFFEQDAVAIFSADPNTEYNAGVFAVKTGAAGRAFLRDWLAEFHPDKWWLEGGRWKTVSPWAGIEYEQSAATVVGARPEHAMQRLSACVAWNMSPLPFSTILGHKFVITHMWQQTPATRVREFTKLLATLDDPEQNETD